MAAVQQVLMLVAATATVSVATACGPMTTISGSQLHCTFPQLNQDKASEYAAMLSSKMGGALGNTCAWAAFLGNVGTESAGLIEWTQVQCDTPFCGRGPLQITGRSNYVFCARNSVCDCGGIVSNPSEASSGDVGVGTAACVWEALSGGSLSRYADGSLRGFLETACTINAGHPNCGQPNGWSSRQAYWNAANRCLSDGDYSDVLGHVKGELPPNFAGSQGKRADNITQTKPDLPGFETADRDVSWWFEARVDGPNQMAQAANFINTHRNIAQGAYIFVPGNINATGNWTWPDQNATNSLLAPVANTGIDIVLAINIDESVMESGLAPSATVAMAKWLAGIKGASGFMIDYEPQQNYTQAHRDKYAFFLKALTNAMHTESKTAHMCVGGNDFLDHNNDFSQWANTGVDRIMSMGITYKDYYGKKNAQGKGEDAVEQMLHQMPRSAATIGIGSMVTPPSAATWDYLWTKEDIEKFVSFLVNKNVKHVSIFRADIENTNGTPESWFIDAITSFLA
eukprot:m.209649 g.209649  ORF g.209649 m.209649 type:complete len:513 (+) comp15475_c0_seq4:276-1814(+)